MALPGYQFACPGLAIGSAPPACQLPFDVLVLCAREYQPSANGFPGTRVVRVPFSDNYIHIPVSERETAARGARVRRGETVLVTCRQGRNRSGLVTACAMVDLGYSPREAIRMVRAARGPDALSNPYFVSLILGMK